PVPGPGGVLLAVVPAGGRAVGQGGGDREERGEQPEEEHARSEEEGQQPGEGQRQDDHQPRDPAPAGSPGLLGDGDADRGAGRWQVRCRVDRERPVAARPSARGTGAAGLEDEGRVPGTQSAPGTHPRPIRRHPGAVDEGAIRRAEVAGEDAVTVHVEREVLAGKGRVAGRRVAVSPRPTTWRAAVRPMTRPASGPVAVASRSGGCFVGRGSPGWSRTSAAPSSSGGSPTGVSSGTGVPSTWTVSMGRPSASRRSARVWWPSARTSTGRSRAARASMTVSCSSMYAR